MKITMHGWRDGAYREIGFTDVEKDEVVAYSGLLDHDDAAALAAQLREVAHDLMTWAQEDTRQGVLPLFGATAA